MPFLYMIDGSDYPDLAVKAGNEYHLSVHLEVKHLLREDGIKCGDKNG